MPLLLAVLICLVAAPAAQAGWFPLESIDGPSPDVERLGGVDLARDGTGGLVYVKRDLGVSHVYVSRLYLGVWRAPERVDTGLDLAVGEAAVAAADNHRLAVVWAAGSRVYGVVYPDAVLPAGPSAPALLYEDDQGRAVSGLSVDMGINGTAFATFTTSTAEGGGDVKAVRLFGTTWERVPGALDVDVAQDAGRGSSRARVAVAADGNPLVVWGEAHADGRRRAYARRIYNLAPSAHPQELSVPAFEGAAGGDADSPDVDIEWDGSFAWAVWRQHVGGVSRTLTRRMRGSEFEGAAAIDNGRASVTPHIAVNGRGTGFTSAAAGDILSGAEIKFDKLAPAARVDEGGIGGEPLLAVSDNDNTDAAYVWRGPSGDLRGRYKGWELDFEPETSLTRPELGALVENSFAVAGDRTGDFAVAALVGDGAGRRIAVAVYDVVPGTPVTPADRGFQRNAQPRIRWRAGLDLWGQQVFKVLIDGVEVGETTASAFKPPQPLADGRHTWQVIAVDARGQRKPSRVRRIGVDASGPRVEVKVGGRRKAGNPVRITARAFDGRGSGVRSYLIDFGDRTRPVAAARATHRFRAGRYTVRVKATDKLGNVGVKRVRLRIAR